MRHTNDGEARPSETSIEACLGRTRKAVLNVLVGVSLMIAASGWLIRHRAAGPPVRPARGLHDGLLFAMLAAAVASYLVRRRWVRREASGSAGGSESEFYWSHVGSAAVAALGVPLGLAYGWFVDPSLQGVAPFWVIPVALGLLAIPRRGELNYLSPPPPNREAPSI